MSESHSEVLDDETGEGFEPAVEINASEDPPAEDPPVEKPEDEEKPDKVKFDEAQQVVFDREIDKKVQLQRTAERRAATAEATLAEIEAKTPKPTRPGIPELPDTFDENYDVKMQARDKLIADVASFDARLQQVEEQEQATQQRTQREGAEKLQTAIKAYGDRATGLGISQSDLEAAATKVAAAGVDDALTMHIVDDEQGPLITMYLGDNPRVLDQVATMDPTAVGRFIERNVIPNLSGKPISQAPSPPQKVNGGGSPTKERGPPRARFE